MTYVDASLNEGSENKVLRRLLWPVRQDLRSGWGRITNWGALSGWKNGGWNGWGRWKM